MKPRVSFLCAAIAIGAVVFPSGALRAADSIAEAKAEFQQGREAFDRNDFKTALERFKKSQELHPTPGTLLNLALTEEQLGMVLSASQHLRDVIVQLPPKDDRILLAKEHLAAVEPRIPKLQILTCSAPPGTRVTRDGEIVAGERLGADVAVEPGAHSIVVSAPGRPDKRYDVTLEEGKRRAIAVEPGQEPPPPPAPPAAPVEPRLIAAPAPSGAGARQIAGFTAAGIGLAGIGVGAVTGLLSMSIKGDVDAICGDGPRCSEAGVRLEDTGKALGTASTVSFMIGAVGAGAGAFLLLWKSGDDPSKGAAEVGPEISSSGARLGLRGRF